MSLRRLPLALLFCGVFLVALVAFAPASVIGYVLQRASGGALSLAQTSGSLWHGAGVALLRQKTGYRVLGRYRWQLRPLAAALQVQAGDAAPMRVRYLPLAGSIAIDNLRVELPVSIMEIAAPQLGPYQLDGTLAARSDHVVLDAKGMGGNVTLDWEHAGSALSEIRPLGDYRIQVEGKGAEVAAQLSTLSGKLQLTATGSFDGTHGMRINGTAQAASPEAATELSELLHHIGPEIRPGVFALALMPQPAALP